VQPAQELCHLGWLAGAAAQAPAAAHHVARQTLHGCSSSKVHWLSGDSNDDARMTTEHLAARPTAPQPAASARSAGCSPTQHPTSSLTILCTYVTKVSSALSTAAKGQPCTSVVQSANTLNSKPKMYSHTYLRECPPVGDPNPRPEVQHRLHVLLRASTSQPCLSPTVLLPLYECEHLLT
jgi:hypothetical protein